MEQAVHRFSAKRNVIDAAATRTAKPPIFSVYVDRIVNHMAEKGSLRRRRWRKFSTC